MTKRFENRQFDQIRETSIQTDILDFADGSALIEMGHTRVITSATIEEKVPYFLKGNGMGWIKAEYAMLPRSTGIRTQRDRGPRMSGRTQEIQRLIGRALRAVTDLKDLGERTIIIDCDVLQADGGTRCASVTGGCISLALALKKLLDEDNLDCMPLRNLAGAVSVGVVEEAMLLDLDYSEDSNAAVDMNVVATDTGNLVEVQVSAEKEPFPQSVFDSLLELSIKGVKDLIRIQKEILKEKSPLFIAYD
jgi:ribonuclease PH